MCYCSKTLAQNKLMSPHGGLNTKYAHDSEALQRLCTNFHLTWSSESIIGIETGFADREKNKNQLFTILLCSRPMHHSGVEKEEVEKA